MPTTNKTDMPPKPTHARPSTASLPIPITDPHNPATHTCTAVNHDPTSEEAESVEDPASVEWPDAALAPAHAPILVPRRIPAAGPHPQPSAAPPEASSRPRDSPSPLPPLVLIVQ